MYSFSVLESLNKTFGEPELLRAADGNGWRPEKGADKVDAHKGSRLIAKGLPNILQLHLKRFNYDWQTGVTSKLNNRFSFPEVLDLSSFCSSDNEEPDDHTVFDLQSVVVHVGEFGVGHYYSYVRPDIRSDIWYRFNDDNVDRVNFQDVLDDAYGGRSLSTKNIAPKRNLLARIRKALQGGGGGSFGWGGSTSNAYVVQYVRRCDIPRLYPNDDC
jgi:ubiquitin carboxyl-terminal hydrolase 7